MKLYKKHVSDLGKVITGKTPRTSILENYGGKIPFLTPSDNLSEKFSPTTSKTLTKIGLNEVKNCLLPSKSICVSCIGSDLGKVVLTKKPTVTNQQFNSIVPNEENDADFIYYLMTVVGKHLNYLSKTSTAVPIINKSTFANYEIEIPNIKEQKRIGEILSSLDDKIELNRRINDNLEQQAQVLFNHYFVDTPEILGDCTVGNLTDIASYLNGLAMQKYRPTANDAGIPVLKIKELGQGKVDEHSDQCSENIDSQYKVDNGDIIFSWSGTLMVKIWCGGECGLNQHLFKVTSEKYPKWFYYFWTLHHLKKFIHIAQDKAVTMGHIKRSELEKSEVLIPSNKKLIEIDKIISPLLAKIIALQTECRNLTALRDTLLPKLMSGEVEINKINN